MQEKLKNCIICFLSDIELIICIFTQCPIVSVSIHVYSLSQSKGTHNYWKAFKATIERTQKWHLVQIWWPGLVLFLLFSDRASENLNTRLVFSANTEHKSRLSLNLKKEKKRKRKRSLDPSLAWAKCPSEQEALKRIIFQKALENAKILKRSVIWPEDSPHAQCDMNESDSNSVWRGKCQRSVSGKYRGEAMRRLSVVIYSTSP